MRVEVRVVPGARQPGITMEADGGLTVRVNPPAREGRANAAVVKALAGYFRVPRRCVHFLSGATSRRKLVEIDAPAG